MKQRKEKTKHMKNSVGRAAFVALSLLLQIGYLVYLIARAGKYYPYIALGTEILALTAVVSIYSQHKSSASKLSWVILILVFPLLGICLYLLLGQPWATRSMRRRLESIDRSLEDRLTMDRTVLGEVEEKVPGFAGQARYLQDWAKFPVYKNTAVEFHPQGEIAFESLKRELRRAEKFIPPVSP